MQIVETHGGGQHKPVGLKIFARLGLMRRFTRFVTALNTTLKHSKLRLCSQLIAPDRPRTDKLTSQRSNGTE